MNEDSPTPQLTSSSSAAPSPRPASPLPDKPAGSSRTVMLWWHLSQVLWRLAKGIEWKTLSADNVRRLDAILELLEGEIHLARTEGRVSEEGKRRVP